jgi:DNA repair protein RecN (Recombination protein N)
MLKQLTIQNYVLISKLAIDFPQGMSVITGETGAGKSIIIGALSLILGQRADAKSIKQNEDKCLIEGLFDISAYQLESFFIARDLEYDAHNCLLRREIWRSGKSRAFINDSPVGLNDLKDLGAFLIDIHSQHQNLLLADNKFQLQVVDVLAGNRSLRETYKTAHLHYLSISKQLQELTETARKHSSEQEYLRFQFQQLDEAKLLEDEQTELENETSTLSHVEEIKHGLHTIEQLLSSDDRGIIASLKEALTAAQAIQKLYPTASETVERLQTAYFDLKDILPDINHQQERLEWDPERLQWLNQRLDLLYTLQQKHKVASVEALIDLRDKLKTQLEAIENYDETIANTRLELEKAEKTLLHIANDLTQTRLQAAAQLETRLTEQISALGMPFVQFLCTITPKPTPDTTGLDDIAFLFSANRNVPVQPVAQTASGGEISRLMLGIKALIAGVLDLPTIIFDEIDTGVSGETADRVGGIMHHMSRIMQVIAITHLPQIAARGDSHLFVYKEENDITETHIRRLTPAERIREIAQMLSGAELTEAAIANAKELLKQNTLK